jgi:hypothetical protein
MKTFKNYTEETVNEASMQVHLKNLRRRSATLSNLIDSNSKSTARTAIVSALGKGFEADFDEIGNLLEDAQMALEEIIMAVEHEIDSQS